LKVYIFFILDEQSYNFKALLITIDSQLAMTCTYFRHLSLIEVLHFYHCHKAKSSLVQQFLYSYFSLSIFHYNRQIISSSFISLFETSFQTYWLNNFCRFVFFSLCLKLFGGLTISFSLSSLSLIRISSNLVFVLFSLSVFNFLVD